MPPLCCSEEKLRHRQKENKHGYHALPLKAQAGQNHRNSISAYNLERNQSFIASIGVLTPKNKLVPFFQETYLATNMARPKPQKHLGAPLHLFISRIHVHGHRLEGSESWERLAMKRRRESRMLAKDLWLGIGLKVTGGDNEEDQTEICVDDILVKTGCCRNAQEYTRSAPLQLCSRNAK
ncbi:hypothetical protein L218DRAFT_948671 [Marasmius fiardii PR-910]|nr:hypothetical protein L218DRAFT_948671 [Marasmius fiardii PR-910]